MSLRIRRGTNSQRTGITFDLGEIVYTTDSQKLYIGDGVTAGGQHILASSVGNGFSFNETTQEIDLNIGNLNLNTSQVAESANLYFTTERAQDSVGAALVAGNSFNTGITFTYDDANNRITAVSTGGLISINADTNPSLGGNLNTGNFNISGNGSFSGTNVTASGTISATTGLGANLSLNAKNIYGTGTIAITGDISNGTIKLSGNAVSGVYTSNEFAVKMTGDAPVLSVYGPAGAFSASMATINVVGQRGTMAAPTTTLAEDYIARIILAGQTASGPKTAVGIYANWTDDAVLTDTYPTSDLTIITGKGSSYSAFKFTANGVFYAPKFYLGNYATTQTLPPQFGGVLYYNTVSKDVQMWDGVGTTPVGGSGVQLKTTAPTIASATTIAPTTPIVFVSGTTNIVTITPYYPMTVGGGQITLIPTGIWSTTGAGNIALGSTAVVGKAMIMTFDALTNKWYPSY